MRHTISCLARNEPGVLAQVARSFAEEQVNILSLAAAPTEKPGVSRMTIVVDGDNSMVDQAERLMQKLHGVLGMEDLASRDFLSRELLLVKVKVAPESIARVMQMAEMFDARVIGVTPHTMTLELAADGQKIDAMLKLLEPMKIVSMARSGRIAVAAGDKG